MTLSMNQLLLVGETFGTRLEQFLNKDELTNVFIVATVVCSYFVCYFFVSSIRQNTTEEVQNTTEEVQKRAQKTQQNKKTKTKQACKGIVHESTFVSWLNCWNSFGTVLEQR